MNFTRIILKLAACISVLVLSSCLESHEEIWLNADGSGAAKFKISMPHTPTRLYGGEKGIRKTITEYIEGTDAFSSYDLKTAVEDDRLHIELALTFDNALKLQEATSPEAMKNLPANSTAFMGESRVGFEGLNLTFFRKIDYSKAIPGSRFIPKKSLKDFKLTTILHLPKAAISHNATTALNGNQTLVWIVPLEKALAAPSVTRFTMPIPIPWLTVSVAIVVILLLIATLIYYIYRRKKRKPRESSTVLE
jgi:hypothetical protein